MVRAVLVAGGLVYGPNSNMQIVSIFPLFKRFLSTIHIPLSSYNDASPEFFKNCASFPSRQLKSP